MLLTCTRETPFVAPTGQMHLQRDVCVMGSFLTLTLLDFRMCSLENKILEAQPNLRPIIYSKYLDGIFFLSKNLDQVLKLRNYFTINFFFKFDIRIGKIQKLNFFMLLWQEQATG